MANVLKKVTILALILVFFVNTNTAFSISQKDFDAIYKNTIMYDPDFDLCSTTPGNSSGSGNYATPGLVYVLGDSIAFGSKDAINGSFNSGGWSSHVNAVVGRPLAANTIDQVQANAAELDKMRIATAVVIELGANNLSGDIGPLVDTTFQKIKAINPTAKIYWVDIGSNADGIGANGQTVPLNVNAGTPAQYSRSNTVIYDQAAAKQFTVVPWYKTIFGQQADPKNIDPAAQDVNDFLSNDELHPNDRGESALAFILNLTVTGAGEGPEPAATPNGQVSSPGATDIKWPAGLDKRWIDTWNAAAAEFGTDPKIIAAIYSAEHGGNLENAPWGTDWAVPPASANSSATGPFQFLKRTWNGIASRVGLPPAIRGATGVKLESDPRNDPVLASRAAAAYIRDNGGVPGLPAGSSDQPQGFKPGRSEVPVTVASVAARYNQGGAWHDQMDVAGVNNVRKYADTAAATYLALGGPGAVNSNTGTGCGPTGTAAGVDLDGMVYYSQADGQWGNYGTGSIAECGCGPTSTAMIVATLTGDRSVTPRTIADFSVNGGHQDTASCGTAWSLFPAVGQQWGLQVEDIGVNFDKAAEALRTGGLVEVSVSAGDFTSGGHLIVFRGITADGKFLVADPNDKLPGDPNYQRKSKQEWDRSVLEGQVKNMWVFKK